MRRRRVVGAKQIVGTRNPLVEIFLNQPPWNHARFHDAPQSVIARAHVEGLFAQHVRHGTSQRSECGILEHLQLELAVAIDEVGVGEKSIQLSTSTLKAPSRRLFSKARRSSIFCASSLPE